jgi:hypothetical protein
VLRVSEDRVFDLLVEMVDFSAEHGLPRTAFALEGAIDAFLQDKGLVPQGLPAPASVLAPESAPVPDSLTLQRPAASAIAIALASSAPVREALVSGPVGPDPEGDSVADAGFRSRRAGTMPRRLHLMPSQRVAV